MATNALTQAPTGEMHDSSFQRRCEDPYAQANEAVSGSCQDKIVVEAVLTVTLRSSWRRYTENGLFGDQRSHGCHYATIF